MLKQLFFLFFTIFQYYLLAANNIKINIEADTNTLNYIQLEFYNATEDKEAAENLIDYFKNKFGTETDYYSPTLLAYYGALEAVQAKYTFNPISKFSYVTSGLKKLDKSVELRPDELEIRFLRFAVLHNIPGIFGISKDRQADLDKVYDLLLEENYSKISKELQHGIAEFLINSERLSVKQTASLLMLFPDIQKNE
jgi:hypothetical protein